MMNPDLSAIAEAFSRKAQVYDEFGMGHENLERMRNKVRLHALSFLKPGDRILELNAGTGADAVFFARLGFPVHATDLSPGMVLQIEEKLSSHGLQGKLTAQWASFFELDSLTTGPFQYIFSNMGGVNCAHDLRRITKFLPGRLLPGGFVTWVVMPPVCLWELTLVLRGEFKTATRRLSRLGVLSNVEGIQFMTYYYTPRQVIQAFGKSFRPVRLQGLSVFTPPADHKGFPAKHPCLYRFLRSIDNLLADTPPFNRWGDFFILTMQYQPVSDKAGIRI